MTHLPMQAIAHSQQLHHGLHPHLFRSQSTTTEQTKATTPFQSTSPSPRKHQDIFKRRTLKKGRDIGDDIFVNYVNI
jgi:hypothetical protein